MDSATMTILIICVGPIVAVLLLAPLSFWVMHKDKTDPEFTRKMQPFRDIAAKFFISRKVQVRLVQIIIVAILFWLAYTGQIHYDPDEFNP